MPALIAFVFVFLTRLGYVNAFAAALPVWDQWDSEGDLLLRRWVEGTLPLEQLWLPHNEHRILPTRLLSIAIYEVMGEWNNLHSARVNILWPALLASIFTFVVVRDRTLGRLRWAVLPVIIACLALPFSWENFLVGFQSQFYVLLLFTTMAFLLAAWRPTDLRVIALVLVICSLSLLTLAGGLLTAFSVAGMYMLRARQYRLGARELLTVVMLLSIGLIGYGTVPKVPAHDGLGAHALPQFIDAAMHIFGWPVIGYHWPMLLLWLPAGLSLIWLWWTKSLKRLDFVMAACYAWSIGQGMVLAYGRGNGLLVLPSRYTELLTPGLIACAWFALRLIQPPTSGRLRAAGTMAVIAVLGTFSIGHIYRLSDDYLAMQIRHEASLVQICNVQRYLATGDITDLEQPIFRVAPPDVSIPYPIPARLKSLLDNPTIRAMLPRSLGMNAAQWGDSALEPAKRAHCPALSR